MVWDSLSQELINKAVKSFTLRLKRCTTTDGEQFELIMWLSKWLSKIRHHSKIPLFKKKTLCCFSDAVLRCSGQTFFSARQSLTGHAKIAITSSCLKIVKSHLAFKCRLDSHVNRQKFQTVAEKTANFRGYFFAAPVESWVSVWLGCVTEWVSRVKLSLSVCYHVILAINSAPLQFNDTKSQFGFGCWCWELPN